MTYLPFIDATFRPAGIRHSLCAIDEKSERLHGRAGEPATASGSAYARDRNVGAACARLPLLRPSSQPRRHEGHDVAQWRMIEDYEAMRKHPTPLPYVREALTIAKFEPGMYEVVETCLPGDSAT
jgi:hypothetical protein